MGTPTVSVIVPVLNGEAFLASALRSVLGQTHRSLEVIVVDDGSSDRTGQVVDGFRPCGIRYVRQENRGAGEARNRGVGEATGEFLAFLDADDLWTRDKLSLQLQAVGSDRPPCMAFGYYQDFVDAPGAAGGRQRQPAPGCSVGTLLVRREHFLKAGLFAAHWRVGEFIDWYARAIDTGLMPVMLPELMLLRRVHAGNTRIRDREDRQEYARVVRSIVERRRRRSLAPAETRAHE